MLSLGKRCGLAALIVALTTVTGTAQSLLRFDMELIPLNSFDLAGGSYIATLYEDEKPFSSKLLIECQDCPQTTDVVVGVEEDTTGAGDFFRSDPLGYLSQLNADCHAQAVACQVTQSKAGGFEGYAYVARYDDGFYVVEQSYHASGLRFVIIATGPSLKISQANVATMLRVVGPYVSGQKK